MLAFYRVVLRAARTRDAAQREPIQAYARAEFERCMRPAMLGSFSCLAYTLWTSVQLCRARWRRRDCNLLSVSLRGDAPAWADDVASLCRYRELDRRDFQRIEHLLRKVCNTSSGVSSTRWA